MMNSAHTCMLCHSFGAAAVNKQNCDIMNVVLCPRSKLQRDQDRDISELIALGVPNPRSASEAQYDQRLFNQSKVWTRHTCSVTSVPTGVACVVWTHTKPERQKINPLLSLSREWTAVLPAVMTRPTTCTPSRSTAAETWRQTSTDPART